MNVTFQNIKLNIYDLQNYDFFANFFSTEKKIRKIR